MSSFALASPRGIANAGPRTSRPRRKSRSVHRHSLTGPIAWVDPRASLVVLRVQHASRRARRFVGATVTVSLAGARVSAPDRDGDGVLTAADLLPGERITVAVTLPVDQVGLPPVVAARSALCESFD